jgi:hypothetical protein
MDSTDVDNSSVASVLIRRDHVLPRAADLSRGAAGFPRDER